MDELKQAPAPEAPAPWPEGVAPAPLEIEPDPRIVRARRGIRIWLGILLVLGLGGLLLNQPETAGLVVLGGLFAVSHAADLDPRWRGRYELLGLIPPACGVVLFAYLIRLIATAELPAMARWIGCEIAVAGIVFSAACAVPRLANRLVTRLFGTAEPSHSLRLAARLTGIGILLGVPAWLAFHSTVGRLLEDAEPLLDEVRLAGSLVGYVLLALGGVGCWVRRDLRESFARLGIATLARRHAATMVVGVVALVALNTGAETVQHRWFPALWQADQEITRLIAKDLTPARVLLLGLSAGIGEEITLRGALQPRLGIVLTSLLFASFHVQYSWYGIALVFALGLTLGLIRKHTSTSAAMVVHGLYDMLAIFTTP